MNKRLVITLVIAVGILALVLFLRSGPGTDTVWRVSDGGQLLAPLVVVSALLDSINPCAFAILLVTIAVLLGLGAARWKLLIVGGAYISGIFIAYLAIGLGILGTLHLFSVPHFMGKLGALLLIVWGLINLINEYIPSFPIKLRVPRQETAAVTGRLLSELPVDDLTVEDPPIEEVIEMVFAHASVTPEGGS